MAEVSPSAPPPGGASKDEIIKYVPPHAYLIQANSFQISHTTSVMVVILGDNEGGKLKVQIPEFQMTARSTKPLQPSKTSNAGLIDGKLSYNELEKLKSGEISVVVNHINDGTQVGFTIERERMPLALFIAGGGGGGRKVEELVDMMWYYRGVQESCIECSKQVIVMVQRKEVR